MRILKFNMPSGLPTTIDFFGIQDIGFARKEMSCLVHTFIAGIVRRGTRLAC